VVVAPCTVEVVRRAGGWLFDRVMAGWDATVLVADHTNARPLRILGAGVANLDTALSHPLRAPTPHAIAVEANLYDSDERVRRLVREAAAPELWLWGNGRPAGSMQHRLSVAARAFKAHALAAAAAPPAAIAVPELFHRPAPLGGGPFTANSVRRGPLLSRR
jgi:hypothetical protein